MKTESRQRVFVSSVVEGFDAYRSAARQGVEGAGCEPILVNEDFPATGYSSRNVCLDAVDSADVFMIVVGDRGGWVAPSGKLVVEEEYERAIKRGLPVLAFIQNGRRDADAERLVRRLSDYVDGQFRKTFNTPEELQASATMALQPYKMKQASSGRRGIELANAIEKKSQIQNQAAIRLVVVPEREEEVIDPIALESDDFQHQVLTVGHEKSVGILSFGEAKEQAVKGHSLIITQGESTHRHRDLEQSVVLELSESGLVMVEANVTNRVRRGSDHSMLNSFVIAVEDMESVLNSGFRFVASLYNEIDKFQRHQRFLMNAVLMNLGHRNIERNPRDRSSWQVSSFRSDQPIVAYDAPRVLTRQALRQCDDEVARIITLLSRKAKAD